MYKELKRGYCTLDIEIPEQIIDFYNLSKSFFQLSLEKKKKYFFGSTNKYYQNYNKEKFQRFMSVGYNPCFENEFVNPEQKNPNYRESFSWSDELSVPQNLWPDDQFKNSALLAREKSLEISKIVFKLIDEKLAKDHYNSIDFCRILKTFPSSNIEGISHHYDYDLFTLIYNFDNTDGFQFYIDDDWVDAKMYKNTITVISATGLSYWSGGDYESLCHRVICQNQERNSMVHFIGPNLKNKIKNLTGEQWYHYWKSKDMERFRFESS